MEITLCDMDCGFKIYIFFYNFFIRLDDHVSRGGGGDKGGRKCTYKFTLWRLRITIAVTEMQKYFHPQMFADRKQFAVCSLETSVIYNSV
jgi:hypothetical protein